MPPGELEDHPNIGFAIYPAAVEHSRLQDSIESTLQEFPVYLIGVAAARIALILLRAQLRTDLCRPCDNLGRKGVAGSDGIGGHCSLYANSERQTSLDPSIFFLLGSQTMPDGGGENLRRCRLDPYEDARSLEDLVANAAMQASRVAHAASLEIPRSLAQAAMAPL
jgi:hypothetical protein